MGKTKSKKQLEKTLAAAITLAALCSSGHAFAAEAADDEAEHELSETVITATRTPIQELKANANITVITAKDIEKRHYTDLTEALRDVPGIMINQYAPSGYNNTNKISINGSDAVVFLIDGVRQNYAGGTGSSVASAMKDLSGIERIEVLHGSASTLYGSDAKGGVINIITKKAKNAKAKVNAAYGSFGKQVYAIAYEGSENGLDWRLGYQKDKSNDFSDAHGKKTPSKQDDDTVNVHIGTQLSKASYLALNIHSYQDKGHYFNVYGWPAPKIEDVEIYHIAGDLRWDLQIDDTTKNQMIYGRSEYDYKIGSYGSDIWTTKFSDQFDKKFGDHTLTVGFDFTKDDTQGSSLKDTGLTNRSFYLQDQWDITRTLNLTAGIRHDSSSGFGSHTSPSVSLGYDITPKTHAYISYGGHFLTPTPLQLYGPWGSDPNLKPESGNTKEIGIAHDFGKGLSAAVHYYRRHSENPIRYTSKFINIETEDAHGWDLQLAKRFNSHITARLSYANTHVDKTEAHEENINGYLPKHQWNIGVDYRNRAFDSSLLLRGIFDLKGKTVSGYDFFPANNYWVVDLGMNYKVLDTTKIYLKVNNLFNQFYAEQSAADAAHPDRWYTSPGRSIVVGVEHTF